MLQDRRGMTVLDIVQTRARVACILLLLSPSLVLAADTSRFERAAHTDGSAEWITTDVGWIAFGSRHEIQLVREGRDDLRSRLETAAPVHDAVLVGRELYVAQKGAVRRFDLDAPDLPPTTVALTPAARGRLHLERLPDFLVVGEDGLGVRLLALPLPVHMDHTGMALTAHHELEQLGSVQLEEEIVALAASGTRIFVSLKSGELATIDAADPAEPWLVSRVVLPTAFVAGQLRALAADGSKLYALSSLGLTVLEPVDGALAVDGPYPEVAGRALARNGRTLHIAMEAQGVATFRDNSPTAALHFVTIGNFFFSPQSLTIDSGDTVRWTWAGNPLIPHNVDSCDGSPPAVAASFCSTQPVAAQGTFTSGAPQIGAFIFNRTFTAVGPNPYFCEAHVTGGMTGSIAVNPSPPPGVPDGSPGTPLRVEKLATDGSSLRLHWDITSCAPTNHLVIAGLGSNLPSTPGGTFSLPGGFAVCNPPGSPFDWIGVPDLSSDPSGFLWFLPLARNGATEGSWGKDSTGAERNGPAAGGASGQCGITAKSLSNLCGQ